MNDKKTENKDAGQEYAEIWGEAIHSNRHLRVLSIGLGVGLILLIIVVIRIVSVEPPRPIVVRVDEIGRAEAVAYEAMEAQADPLDPTTKYFLNRFIHDFYSRRRATVEEHWSRSLRFLSTDLANASFRAESQNIALLAAGAARAFSRGPTSTLQLQVKFIASFCESKPTPGAPQRHGRFRSGAPRQWRRTKWSGNAGRSLCNSSSSMRSPQT